LFILVGRFLIVMRVTLSSRIRATMWLLCMFFGLPFGHYIFSRAMVVGLFSWSWHQRISEVGLRVAIMPRYMLYGLLGGISYASGLHFHWHCHQMKWTEVIPLSVLGTCYCPMGISLSYALCPTLPIIELLCHSTDQEL
jgi:hypothetical protein